MTTDTTPIFIVADDHPLVRGGVRMILETEYPSCRIVETGDLDSTLLAIGGEPGALLLIDLDMPGMDGVESLRALRQGFPTLLMAVLSANAETATIFGALRAGVNGYIVKAASPDEMLHAIATIRGGRVYLGHALSDLPVHDIAPPAAQDPPQSQQAAPLLKLTPRQRDVVTHLMKGHSNKQIARDLHIGEGTVKIHLAAVFRHLGVQNRTEAVLRAGEFGL